LRQSLLDTTAYVIFEFNDEHLALEFRCRELLYKGESSVEQFERVIDEQITELMPHLSSIQKTVDKFQVGKRDHGGDYQVHVISRYEDKWIMHPVKSWLLVRDGDAM
jgi:hypothetical protein